VPWRNSRRNWNRLQPTSLPAAFAACKDYGIERRRLSVERLAELMAITPSCLYKWMEEGAMPAARVAQFEHLTGAGYVSAYLAAGSGAVVVKIPTGRPAEAEDVGGLQLVLHDAVGKVIQFWRGTAGLDETVEALTVSLQALAFHRENIAKSPTPELGLEAGDDE